MTTETTRGPGYPYGEMDAMKWAEEFDRIFLNSRPDTGTMLAWFANAIMTGFDTAMNREGESRAAVLAEAVVGDVLIATHVVTQHVSVPAGWVVVGVVTAARREGATEALS